MFDNTVISLMMARSINSNASDDSSLSGHSHYIEDNGSSMMAVFQTLEDIHEQLVSVSLSQSIRWEFKEAMRRHKNNFIAAASMNIPVHINIYYNLCGFNESETLEEVHNFYLSMVSSFNYMVIHQVVPLSSSLRSMDQACLDFSIALYAELDSIIYNGPTSAIVVTTGI